MEEELYAPPEGGVGTRLGKVTTTFIDPDMRLRAIEAASLAESNLIAKGATSYVIGVAIQKNGHDHWQLRMSGPCLSTMALVGELREWCEEQSSGVVKRPSKPTSWWKIWRYRPTP